MNVRRLIAFLVCMDWTTCLLSWIAFYYIRKVSVEQVPFEISASFYWGIAIVPLLWLLLYYLQGTYHQIKRLYRLRMFNLTFVATIIGTIFIFFGLLLDDEITGYKMYYKSLLWLFVIQLIFSLVPRWFFVTYVVRQIQSGKNGFRTLLIGGSDKALDAYMDISQVPKSVHVFIGFVKINGADRQLETKIPFLGSLDDLEKIIRSQGIEEIIIALDSTEHDKLKTIISRIEGVDVSIKILPDMYDILSGSVKMTNIFGALLIEVNTETMPVWQQTLKRFLDVVLSLIALILLTPVYIGLAIAVRMSSPGPVFFIQDRVGLGGHSFRIIKFRTMYVDAEKSGPQLSSSDDPRITAVGKYMRKLRLDEFPQFFNVLRGDMSLVGPRPERQFYIDQIIKIEPQFLHLTRVRPGITSWGQVKYGYAENVEQMLQRMKYDLLYIKNRTIALDFKILLYTVLIIVRAKGK
jgi:exopolysaccharide biosynthesis polyprenyl glycosylphosphotransferase